MMSKPTPATHSNSEMQWIKFLLCTLNFSFLLTGVTIVLKSKAIHDVHNQFDYFFNSNYISPIVLLITAGVFLIAVSIFSCYGAIKESTCMVLISAFLLSTVIILEFAASVALYVARDDIVDHLKSKISDAMHQYDNNSEAKKAVDFLQGHLQCCGWNGPDDWIGIDGRTSIYRAPCWTRLCKENEFSCYNLINQGCFGELGKIAKNRASYLTSAASSIILIQISGIILACMLGRMIRKQKILREMHQWQTTFPNLDGSSGKTADSFIFSPIFDMEDDNIFSQKTRSAETKNPVRIP